MFYFLTQVAYILVFVILLYILTVCLKYFRMFADCQEIVEHSKVPNLLVTENKTYSHGCVSEGRGGSSVFFL